MKSIQFGTVNVIAVIQSMEPVLNTAEKALANYLLENVNDIISLTIEQVAQNSGTSYSTVVLFCQKLGFQGFKDFKKKLTNDIIYNESRKDENMESYTISYEESERQICEKTFGQFENILQSCASLLNFDTLSQAVDMILNASMLYIIGSGASAASALYAYTQLIRIGRRCAMESDPTIYQMKASLANEGEVLIAISSSGRTVSVVSAAEKAKERGANVISISDFLVSPLQQTSDICLYTTTRNSKKYVDIDIPHTIGQIAIIDILYSCCCVKLGDKGNQLYQITKEATDMGKSK